MLHEKLLLFPRADGCRSAGCGGRRAPRRSHAASERRARAPPQATPVYVNAEACTRATSSTSKSCTTWSTNKGLKVRTQPITSHKPFAASAAQTRLGLADNLDTATRPTQCANHQKAQGEQSNLQNPGVGDHRQFFWTLRFQCARTRPCRMSTPEKGNARACTHAAARDARSRASECGKRHEHSISSMQHRPTCSSQVQAQSQPRSQSPPQTQPQTHTQPADDSASADAVGGGSSRSRSSDASGSSSTAAAAVYSRSL